MRNMILLSAVALLSLFSFSNLDAAMGDPTKWSQESRSQLAEGVTMPTSPDILLADDIVNELNSESRDWSLEFTAERTWEPNWHGRAGELETLQVSVNPDTSAEAVTLGERVGDDYWIQWNIVVAFAKQLQDKTRAEIDGLADCVEEVRQFLDRQAFAIDGTDFKFAGIGFQYLARFDQTSLTRSLENNQVQYSGKFLSAFRVTYLQYSS